MQKRLLLRETAAAACRCLAGVIAGLLLLAAPVRVLGMQPVVAIHDSELTRALETLTATNTSTPSGPGTTGYQWWPTNWHYFVMPDALKQMLLSDGTAFTVVGDSNIAAGALLDSNGLPNYPIVFSLASEAISNTEIAPFTNYVAAGGCLFIGSSAFTRNPDGSSRNDFAFAAQMGLHTRTPGLTNWLANSTFTAVSGHPLISNIPQGTLNWQMPWSADEISWPEANHVAGPPSGLPHLIWQVQPAGATVLAAGDTLPYLLIMPYGKGCFIYDAAMQPVLGHGGWAPGMYSYTVIRNAIQLAFQSQNAPVVKLSPWPYQYDAAVMFRHDMEAIPALIDSIGVSAQYENARGAKGDYFFCTGELREDMPNPAATVALLQAAVSNYGATVASHNGGLTNPNIYLPPLTTNSYDYWHWGPDEVLDTNPPGYASGQAYALVSVSNSFSDIQGWGLDNTNGIRLWVTPYFNATREPSLQIEQQLGVQITGDDKIGPFPHFTLSSQTPDQIYPFISLPVSDWYLGNQVAQAMEDGYGTNDVHALVDFYYNLGGLINLYSHSSSDGSGPAGSVASDYVNYSLSKPRIWAANSIGLYQWWTNRANAQVLPTFSTNGNQWQASLTVAGAATSNTAVEFYLPSASYYGLQVSTNGVAAGTNGWRTTGQTVKVLVGTTVTNVQIQYSLPPVAQNDVYTMNQGDILTVAKPGVLSNDVPGTGGTNLTASPQTLPAHATLTLHSNGSFTYNPDVAYGGVDNFQYQDSDTVTNSGSVTAAVEIVPPGNLFYDDFERPSGSGSILPWVQQLGAWSITNETLVSTSAINSYGYAYYSNQTWTDYTAQASVQFSAANAFGGGIGARLNPATGAHYAAWVYPEGSYAGSAVLKLVKFEGWATWSGIPMQQVSLPGVGTNWHTVTLSVQGPVITVYYDGVREINLTDLSFDNVLPFTNGGISADMFTYPSNYTRSLSNMSVTPLNAPLIMFSPQSLTNNAGTTAMFSVATLGSNLNYQWFKGASPISGATAPTLTLTNVLSADAAAYSVVVSNALASATSGVATLTVIDPFITAEPVGATNNAGTTASFAVAAVGTPSLAYRWYKNGNPLSNGGRISGATSTNLHLSNVGGGDDGLYTVVVTGVGTATSTPPAQLTVIDPIITSQPPGATNNAGTTAMFTVGVAGTSPAYFWYKNGVLLNNGGNIGGARSATLDIANVLGANDGNYTVVVSNAFGLATNSPPAALLVIDPFITSQPQSLTNYQGTPASFTVGVVGTTPVFQWSRNGLALGGATNATYSIAAVSNTDAGTYRVVVSNFFGNPASSNATLTVLPSILIQSVTVTNGIAAITWSSSSGQNYQLQSETSATAADWTNVNGVITATGTNTTTTNAITSAIQFYRVHAVP